MSKTAEEILFIRNQAITALELSKGFTPEQRAEFSNSLKTVELFAGYIIELTNTSAAQEVEAYKGRLKTGCDNLLNAPASNLTVAAVEIMKALIDTVK